MANNFLIIVVLSLCLSCGKDILPEKAYDWDGNDYDLATIGTQTWFAENLRAAHYADGSEIPLVVSDYDWIWRADDARCFLHNDPAYQDTFGTLYNWDAVMDSSGLCPTGWHVPSKDEWKTLIDYLGGTDIAGGKMKMTDTLYWESPNEGATNESGFSALPGGARNHTGLYVVERTDGIFWSTTVYNHTSAWLISLDSRHTRAELGFGSYEHGFYVRCLRDTL